MENVKLYSTENNSVKRRGQRGGNFELRSNVDISDIKWDTPHSNKSTAIFCECLECGQIVMEQTKLFFSKNGSCIPIGIFNANMFHAWFDNVRIQKKELTIIREGNSYYYRLGFRRFGSGARSKMVFITGSGTSKQQQLYSIVVKLYTRNTVQMDGEVTDIGEGMSKIEVSSNTIIQTDGEDNMVNITSDNVESTMDLCNSEKTYTMPELTDRFELLMRDKITVGTEYSKEIILPRDLLTTDKINSANMSLFRNFVYGVYEIEFKIIVNSPQFNQGKLIISWFPDPSDSVSGGYFDKKSMIVRDHVLLDLSNNNTVTIVVPQTIRRSMLRNFLHETSNTGLATNQGASLQIRTFSNMVNGPGQPNTVPITYMYRFTQAKFAGMSFAVTPQGPIMDVAKAIYPELGAAETLLKRAGFIGNNDKPYFPNTQRFVPTPRREFCSGMGLADAIPLHFDGTSTVTTLTEYINSGDPKSFTDLAQKWGYLGNFEWKADSDQSKPLWQWRVSPTERTFAYGAGDTQTSFPTPLDFAASQFAFWRGTLKLKFIFVSTQFHKGTIQFEIQYNRYADTVFDGASTYTKTFDLGETREVEVDVPYIYDTPWRRTQETYTLGHNQLQKYTLGVNNDVYSYQDILSTVTQNPLCTRFINNTMFSVRCLNALTPLQNVAQTISTIVLIKANDDIEFSAIMPNFWMNPKIRIRADENINDRYFKQFPMFYDNQFVNGLIEEATRVSRVAQSTRKPGAKFLRGSKDDDKIERADWNVKQPTKSKKTVAFSQNDFGARAKTARHFHSTDLQTDFKTVLRRNYLLRHIGVTGSRKPDIQKIVRISDQVTSEGHKYITFSGYLRSAHWIPCMLPNHFSQNARYPIPRASAICAIPSMFRHWRGSLRYVFVETTGTKKPVYFTYIPNLGVKYEGNIPHTASINLIEQTDKDNKDVFQNIYYDKPIAQSGFATEIMQPGINNSISIAVPFECEFNRCVVTNRLEDSHGTDDKTFMARDDVTDISGHIAIECDDDCEFDVWISAGDDYELMNFIGFTEYFGVQINTIPDSFKRDRNGNQPTTFADFRKERENRKITYATDNAKNIDMNFVDFVPRAQQQMDFFGFGNVTDRLQLATADVVKQAKDANITLKEIGKDVTRAVDSAEQVSKETVKTSEKLGATLDDFTKNLGKITDSVEKVGGGTDRIMSELEPLLQKINSALNFESGAVGSQFFHVSRDFLFDLIILLRNFDYINFGLTFMKYLAKFFDLGLETVTTYATKIAKKMNALQSGGSTEQFSEHRNEVGSFFGLFVGLLATILKFKFSDFSNKKFFDHGSPFKDFCFDVRNVNYINSMITLVERIFKIFGSAVRYCLNYKPVQETLVDALKEEHKDIVHFMNEVDIITHPANKVALNRADMKARIWRAHMYSNALSTRLAACKPGPGTMLIMRYVNKIDKFTQENWCNFTCAPVRYEPRVYCFAGASNIGKSFVNDFIVHRLLSRIGYKHVAGNPTYTYVPGLKHFDGYENQPVIRFDDWMNLKEPERMAEEISLLYQLKSSCDFIPPKASVEQKGAKANPRLVILLTNGAFPTSHLDNICIHTDAVFRRRDKLIEMRLVDPKVDVTKLKTDLENQDHLEFRFRCPRHDDCRTCSLTTEWMNWNKFMDILETDFVEYNERELRNAQTKLSLFCKDIPEHILKLQDPLDLFNYRTIEVADEIGQIPEELPSMYLAKEVDRCLAMLDDFKVQHQSDKTKFEELFVSTPSVVLSRANIEGVYTRNPFLSLGLTQTILLADLFWTHCNEELVMEKILKDDRYILYKFIHDNISQTELKCPTCDVLVKQCEHNKYTELPLMKLVESICGDIGILHLLMNSETFANGRIVTKPTLTYATALQRISDGKKEHNKMAAFGVDRPFSLNIQQLNSDMLSTINKKALGIRYTSKYLESLLGCEFSLEFADFFQLLASIFPKLTDDFDVTIVQFPTTIDGENQYPIHGIGTNDPFAREGISFAMRKVTMAGVEHDVCVPVQVETNDEQFPMNLGLLDVYTEITRKDFCTYETEKIKFNEKDNSNANYKDPSAIYKSVMYKRYKENYNEFMTDVYLGRMKDHEVFIPDSSFNLEIGYVFQNHDYPEFTPDDPGVQFYINFETGQMGSEELLGTEVSSGFDTGSHKVYFANGGDQMVFNAKLPRRLITCDHCKTQTIFLYGDNKHHICKKCLDNKSVCEYCVTHKTQPELWHAPWMAWFMLSPRTPTKFERFIMMLRKTLWWAFTGVIGFLYLRMFYRFGRAFAGLFMKFGCQNSSKFTDEIFIKGVFSDMMFTQANYQNGVCKHDRLFVGNDPISYNEEYWNLDDDTMISVYPCAKKCWLFEDNNLARYERFCIQWTDDCKKLIAVWLQNKTFQSVPLFCNPNPGEWEYLHLNTKYENWRAKLKRTLSKGAHFIGINHTESWPKILLGISATVLGAIATIKTFFSIFGWVKGFFNTTTPQGEYDKSQRTRHLPNKSSKTRVNYTKMFAKNTTQNDANFVDSLVNNIERNQVVLRVRNKISNEIKELSGVIAYNRNCMMPKHYYEALRDIGDIYEITIWLPAIPNITNRTYEFCESDWIVSPSTDFCIFKVPKTIGCGKNLLSFFQKEEDLETQLPSIGHLVQIYNGNHKRCERKDIKLMGYEARVAIDNSEDVHDVLRYNFSLNGACGSLILKPKSTRPIIAMHVAGNTTSFFGQVGYGVLLTQETFHDLEPETIITEQEPPNAKPITESRLVMDDMVQVENMCAFERKVHIPTDSKIRPSIICTYDGPPKTYPAFLSHHEPDYPHEKSPIVAGCEKHGILTVNTSQEVVNTCVESLWNQFYSRMRPLVCQPKRLTLAQSIRGFNVDGYEPMKLKTAMGYPYVYENNKQKKHYITVSDHEEIEKRIVRIDKQVLQHLQTNMELRQNGIIPFDPYIAELKDERKKIEKRMKLGGTRVFLMSPISITVQGRQNFLHFSAAYKASRLHYQHAVGISRDGPEWSTLANQLLTNSPYIITLDYSNFGPGYNAMFCAAAHEIVKRWTMKYVANVVEAEIDVLGEEHYNSKHIMIDHVYRQFSGGPSGDPLTVVKNGLVNELYVLFAWMHLVEPQQNGYYDMESVFTMFYKNVYLCVYGDDLIMSVTGEFIDRFNGVTITRFFAEYGISATSADKSLEIEPYKNLTDSTFLKSGFKPHPYWQGEWLSPLEELSITETPRWIFESPNYEQATLVNCEAALRNAYGHGPDFFNEFKAKINEALAEKELPGLQLNWRDIDMNFFEKYYIKH